MWSPLRTSGRTNCIAESAANLPPVPAVYAGIPRRCPWTSSGELILDQFTRQAVPFSEMHARDDAGIHRLLIETADIGPEDEVLDVACGPGLVACEVARVARHVTGVDLTRAMIEQAEARQTIRSG